MPISEDNFRIEIDIGRQTLSLKQGRHEKKKYLISAAANGAGEKENSECTPRGKHIICEKIGEGSQVNTVFAGRKPTGERYTPELKLQYPERDWILTRILRLSGQEPGKNQGGDVDSFARFIYIHGAPDEVEMGTPGSHGCIRMHNNDVIELFDLVEVGVRVLIEEQLD